MGFPLAALVRPCFSLAAEASRLGNMSPTIFRERVYRFYFFSREESRMHVHVYYADGEAKFWLEPTARLAQNFGLSAKELHEAEGLVRSHEQEIRDAWYKHFPG